MAGFAAEFLEDEEAEESEEDEEDFLALLRRNNPSETEIELHLSNFSDDVALSEALQANDHVNDIWLNLNVLANHATNWDSLLRVLATRESLETVVLCDAVYQIHVMNRSRGSTPPEQVPPFLLALQQNLNIQTVRFLALHLQGDSVASFLDAATSITKLEMEECVMESLAGARTIAAALQRNTNIRRLELHTRRETSLIPIVNSLPSNSSVKELSLWFLGLSVNSSLAVAHLLESSATIQRLELCGSRHDVDVDTLHPIAQGLIKSTSVTALKVSDCDFSSEEKVRLFISILESKSNLQLLSFVDCSVHVDVQEEFRAAICSLLQPHSLLRNLDLFDNDGLNNYGFGTSQQFAGLLSAVETSPLEWFLIGKIVSRESYMALIASIPKMQVKALKIELHDDIQEDIKEAILRAVKRNASLCRFYIASGVNWFGDEDWMETASYLRRNTFLAQWITSPNAVPMAAWPEYLDAAQVTGPDTVFFVLRALAPSVWG
jgi:hypothetical protein